MLLEFKSASVNFYFYTFTHFFFFFLSSVQNVPPDLAICAFILEQSLSVRALQEMLANTMEMEVRARDVKEQRIEE